MKRRKYKYALFLADGAVVLASFGLALIAHRELPFTIRNIAATVASNEFLLFAAFSPVMMYIFQSNQLYKIHLHLEIWNQMKAVLKCVVYSSVALAIAIFIIGEFWSIADARIQVLYFLVIGSGLLVTERLLVMRPLFRMLVRYKLSRRQVLVVGAGDPLKIADGFGKKNHAGLTLAGFLDDDHPIGEEIIQGKRVLGKVADVERIVEERQIDEILICLEGVPEAEYLNILDRCARTSARVMIGSDQFSVITQHVYTEFYGGIPVFGVMNSTPYFGAPILKRMGDIVLSLVGLLLLSPIMLIIAAAIRLDSRGPVLFRQTRIGKNGTPFTFLKFRSMVVGSDNDLDRVKKLERFIRDDEADDPETTKIVDTKKVTGVGHFIRKTSLDELPQLVNVLRGEMSLVGPRPCLPYEWERYDEWHKKRLSVTPGCTGVWQVFGRSKVGFRDTVIIDLFYMHNMSFRLDLWLVLKTIPVMFFGNGGK